LETLFLQELRAINDYLQLEYNLYYWRTQTGLEVDFIIYGPHGFHAFEIKRSTRVTPQDGKNLSLFAEEYPEAKLYLLYGGTQKYYYNNYSNKNANINVVPIAEMMRELPKIIAAPPPT
jgi:uncharacterized protein